MQDQATPVLPRPRPRFMDLCSGLGIDSVIFVDVEAVIVELLLEPRSQWWNNQIGGQPLAFFAALERLCADLTSCQEIVSERLQFLDFDDQGACWHEPSVRLLRLSLCGFLRAQGFLVHSLDSWRGETFAQLLREHNVGFVLTSDVAGSALCSQNVNTISVLLAAQATYGSASGQWHSAYISQLAVADGRAFGFRTLRLNPSEEHRVLAAQVAVAALTEAGASDGDDEHDFTKSPSSCISGTHHACSSKVYSQSLKEAPGDAAAWKDAYNAHYMIPIMQHDVWNSKHKIAVISKLLEELEYFESSTL